MLTAVGESYSEEQISSIRLLFGVNNEYMILSGDGFIENECILFPKLQVKVVETLGLNI